MSMFAKQHADAKTLNASLLVGILVCHSAFSSRKYVTSRIKNFYQ